MAIALDASTPAATHQAAGTTGHASTVAFSPPSGSYVLVTAVWLFAAYSGAFSVTAADNHGNTYQVLSAQPATYQQTASALAGFHYASAPGSTTVTVTANTTASAAVALVPQVMTGAAASQPGGSAAGVAEAVSVGAGGGGSWLYCCGGHGASSAPATPIPGDIWAVDDWYDSATNATASVCWIGPVATPGPVLTGWGSGINQVAGVEIVAATAAASGGGLAPPGSTGGLPAPAWSTGQVLTAAAVNAWLVPFSTFKPATTARTTTTLINDPDLGFNVAPGGAYAFRLSAIYDGAAGSFLQWQFTGIPAGAFMGYLAAHVDGSGTKVIQYLTGAPSMFSWTSGAGAGQVLEIDGMVHAGASGGGIFWSWAQHASSGTPVSVYQTSYLMAWRIG